MASNTDDLFSNPTNRAAADSLQQSRLNIQGGPTPTPYKDYAAGMDAARPKTRAFGRIGSPTTSDGLAEIASSFPDFAPLAPEGHKHQKAGTDIQDGDIAGSFGKAHSEGWADIQFGASLITGSDDDNMMSLETKYQRQIDGRDIETERWTPEAKTMGGGVKQFFDGKHRFFDQDYWGNFAGGTLPSIETMAAGAVTGFGAGTVTTGVGGPIGALGGAAIGSGGGVYFQTLGGTMKDAYSMYRMQGFSGREAFKKAKEVADIDAIKSGSLAFLATVIAPARLVGRGASTTGVKSYIPAVIFSAPAGEAVKRTMAIQFAQQSLILQPTLETADAISSNMIAKNSYDPNRIFHQGAVDAFVGSIFFDLPTTSGGILIQRALAKYRKERGTTGLPAETQQPGLPEKFVPAFDDPEVDETTPLLTGPTEPIQVSGPRFEARLQEDGSWSVVDKNEDDVYSTDPFLSPETLEQIDAGVKQLEARKQKLETDRAALENAPEAGKKGAQSRQKALNTIAATLQKVAIQLEAQRNLFNGRPSKPDTEETDPTTIFYSEEEALEEAAARNAHSRSEWASPWFPENKQSRATFIEDQTERLGALDARLRKTTTDYTGDSKIHNAIGFLRWLGEADGLIDKIDSLPMEERNSETNQKIYSDAKERMWLLKSLMDPIRIATRTQMVFTAKGTTYRVVMANGAPVKVKGKFIKVYDQKSKVGTRDIAETSGVLEDISIPLPTNMLLNDPDVMSRIQETRRRFVVDQMEKQGLYADQVAPPSDGLLPPTTGPAGLLEGPTDERAPTSNVTSPPRTVLTSTGKVVSQQPEIDAQKEEIDQKQVILDAQEKARTGKDQKDVDAEAQGPVLEVAPDGTINNSWDTSEPTYTDNDSTQGVDPDITDIKASRPNKGLIDKVLAFVPEAQQEKVAKVLQMYADALGPEFDSVAIMDMAEWLSGTKSETPSDVAAIFATTVNKLGETVSRTIAVDFDMETSSVLNELSHELVHLAVKLKNLPAAGMIDWYRNLPSNNSHKVFVENDSYYKTLPEAAKAEEAMAIILSEMSTKRYSGKLHRESGLQYLIRQVVRMYNELYEGVTGTNMVNAFLDNIASYGVEPNPVNEMETFVKASTNIYAKEAFLDGKNSTRDNADAVNPHEADTIENEFWEMGKQSLLEQDAWLTETEQEVKFSIVNDKNPKGRGSIGLIYEPLDTSDIPKKIRTAYKLMRIMPTRGGLMFPLYAKARTGPNSQTAQGFTIGKWYRAEFQQPRIGADYLAPRGGIHALGLPVFDQGKVITETGSKRVWVEVEMPSTSKVTQKESDTSPMVSGQREGIRKRLIGPSESYDFKTNNNASDGAMFWPISGSMKIVKVLGNGEIEKVLRAAKMQKYIKASKSLITDAEASVLNKDAAVVSKAIDNAVDVQSFIPFSELDQSSPPIAVETSEEVTTVKASRIPQHRRAQRAKPAGQSQRNAGGTRYIDGALEKTSAPITSLPFNVKDLWAEVVADYGPPAQMLLDRLAVENYGKEVTPRENAFWVNSLKLPDRARFWYEISSERFSEVLRGFNNPQFIAKFIDIVAATSVQAGPLDNLLRAVSVTSEFLQNKAILTDLTDKGQGAGVNKALSDQTLPGDKTGNFAGTMNYLMGLTDTVPLSTNDRQVAVYFNTTGDVLANPPKTTLDADGKRVKLPNFYDMISEFHIRLRDRLNQQLLEADPTAEPFETWQIQALGWIQIRAENNSKKGDVSGYDDYAQVLDKVFDRLAAVGIDVSAKELSPAILSDPRVPYALRDTLRDFMTAPTATIETLTKNSPIGEVFDSITRLLNTNELDGVTAFSSQALAIQKRTLAELSARKGKAKSLMTRLASAIVGSPTEISRMNQGIGTYEGEANINLRVPLNALTEEHRASFLSMIGIVFRQSAMAAHQIIPAEKNSRPRDGYSRSYRIFVSTLDRDKVTKQDIGQLDPLLGVPTSAVRVANGWNIDLMVGGFEDTVLSPTIIDRAIDKTELRSLGDIYIQPIDYRAVPGMDYVEADVDPDWLSSTGALVQVGYEQRVQNLIEGVTNVAISKIANLDPRINIREAQAFVRGDQSSLLYFRKDKDGKITKKEIPSAVLKRGERIRNVNTGRIRDLHTVESDMLVVFGEQELAQLKFLEAILPKIWSKLSDSHKQILSRPMSLVPEIAVESAPDSEAVADVNKSFVQYSRINPATTDTKKKEIINKFARSKLSPHGIFTASAKRLRQIALNVKASYDLSNILERDQFAYTDVGVQGVIAEDVNSEIEQLTARYSRLYAALLRGMTEAQIKAIPDILRGKDAVVSKKTGLKVIRLPKGFPIAKAKEARKVLDDMWSDLEKIYTDQGLTPPAKIVNYFPQRYQLNGKMHGMEKDQVMESFFEAVFTGKMADAKQRDRARNAAQMVVGKIKNEHYQPVWGNDLDIRDEAQTRGRKKQAYSITTPELTRIINLDPYKKIDVVLADGTVKQVALVDFLDNDLGMVMNNYITSMARRVRFAARFGIDGRIVSNFVNQFQRDVFNNPLHEGTKYDANGDIVYYTDKDGELRLHKGKPVPMSDTSTDRIRGKIDANLLAEGQSPLSGEQRQMIMEIIRLNMGIVTTGHWYKMAREPMQAVKFLGNLSLLSLSAWQSLAEPMLIAQRLGFMPMLYGIRTQMHEILRIPAKTVRSATLTYADGPQPTTKDRWRKFREHYGYDQTDTKEFAKDLGIIFENMQYVLQNTVEDVSVVRWDKLNNSFFRANLLQPLTETQQVAALTASMQALHTWRRKALRGNKTAIENLLEVGLTVDQMSDYDKTKPQGAANNAVRAALRQMNRQIIMAPSPGKKPSWMLDPRFTLVAHIKTWIFTFNNTVLQRAWRELLKKRNPMPLIYLAGFGMMSAQLYEWREWARWGDEGNPYLNKIGLEKGNPARFAYLSIERGGMAGPFQFLMDSFIGSRTSTVDIASSLIPTVNIVQRGLGGVLTMGKAPFTEDPQKTMSQGLSEFTRAIPVLNATGQYRKEVVEAISGYTKSSKSKTKGSTAFRTPTFKRPSFKRPTIR